MKCETVAPISDTGADQARSNFPVRATGAAWPVAWGLVLRLATVPLLHTWRFPARQEHFAFGYEVGRIARALASGQGFSNPFHGITGPTAWEAPLYPSLVGGIFKLTGIYTPASAILILWLNCVFSALTAVPVYWIAHRIFGPRPAKWAAWTWALLPYTMYWATRWVWETSMTAFLLTTAVWLALEIAEAGTHGLQRAGERIGRPAVGRSGNPRLWKLWAWFGFLWGIIALTNPACLTFLPFAGGWACFQLARQRQPWFRPATLSAVIFLVLITPWEVRNYRVFHQFIPIRGNGGVELRLGNSPDANGLWAQFSHPTENVIQARLYREMGEAAYVRMRGREALEFMRQNPARTARLWLTKATYFWAGVPRASDNPVLAQAKNSLFLASSILAWLGLGLMVLRRRYGWFLLASLMLVYPLAYYIAFPLARYRHPIEPVMLILAAYLISESREMRAHAAQQENTALPTPSQPQSLSIVIPCFNEKTTIRMVVETVLAADSCGLQKEIVIVDDFSRDGTRELLPAIEDESHNDPRGQVKVLYHEKNQGKGAAVRTGFAGVTGDLVLVQDADLEYDPADYPALLQPILQGRADAVFGNRFHGGTHRVLYFWHFQANQFLTLLCNMFSDLNLSDMEVGYKVFRREILQRLKLKSDRFGFEPEVTIKTARLGVRLYEVPIAYHGRTYAEGKKIGWKDGVAALWHMVKYRFFD